MRAQQADERRHEGEEDDEPQARHRRPVAEQDLKLPAVHSGLSDR